jgi:hypothetical protein
MIISYAPNWSVTYNRKLRSQTFMVQAAGLPTNTRPGWKSMQGTNTPAYLAKVSVTKKKRYMTLPPGPRRPTSTTGSALTSATRCRCHKTLSTTFRRNKLERLSPRNRRISKLGRKSESNVMLKSFLKTAQCTYLCVYVCVWGGGYLIQAPFLWSTLWQAPGLSH